MAHGSGCFRQARKAWPRLWHAVEPLTISAPDRFGDADRSRNPIRSRHAEARHGDGPDFVYVGMQKAGTSWLFDQMNAREDVWMPPIKELNYFTGRCLKPGSLSKIRTGGGSLPAVPRIGDKWRRLEFLERFGSFQEHQSDIHWYRRLFEVAGRRVTGDVSPGYSKLDEQRIEELCGLLPHARFLILLRDPVERFWSSVCMKARKNKIDGEGLESWSSFRRIFEDLMRNPESRECFGSQIWSKYARHVPRERLRHWFFDDIRSQPEIVVDEVCDFLDIRKGRSALDAGFNRKSGLAKKPLPDDIHVRLVDYFRDEYERSAAMFGGHAKSWLERAGSVPTTSIDADRR